MQFFSELHPRVRQTCFLIDWLSPALLIIVMMVSLYWGDIPHDLLADLPQPRRLRRAGGRGGGLLLAALGVVQPRLPGQRGLRAAVQHGLSAALGSLQN